MQKDEKAMNSHSYSSASRTYYTVNPLTNHQGSRTEFMKQSKLWRSSPGDLGLPQIDPGLFKHQHAMN